MAANTDLIVTGLDFDVIRANLRNFLADKPEFADYDFQDSAIGTLLDLLAYNTYYQAFYANMATAEGFLDSAQLYDSVISRAKAIGYLPSSARGATANLQIIFTNSFSNATFRSITIPKNTKFNTTVNGNSYRFVTPQTYTVTANSTGGFSSYINITEGQPLTHRFLFNRASNTSFVLPNENVDTSSITVSITTSGNTQTYTRADDITTVNSSSKVYYIEADRGNKYKVLFGDGVFGVYPTTASIVEVSYRVCNGEAVNGVNDFSLVDSIIDGQGAVFISPIGRSSGGAAMESIESVRRNAPLAYETQNRAVINNDYERILLRDNPDIQAISTWGGEDNDPPIYGKVFVCAKPKVGNIFSTNRKDTIRLNLKKYNVQSIDVEMVDPTFLYVIPSVISRVDLRKTTLTPGEIASRIARKITQYETINLNTFGKRFRYSKFLEMIDSADDAITTSDASIRTKKMFIPSLTTPSTYKLKFNHPIQGLGGYIDNIPNNISLGTITSSPFTFKGYPNCYFDDNGYGTLQIYYPVAENTTAEVLSRNYLSYNAGTVNYESGIVEIIAFLPQDFIGDAISIITAPTTTNVVPIRNQILLMAQSKVQVIDDLSGNVVANVTSIETIGQTQSSVIPGGRLNNF
jgi:hypothetical protein